MTLTEMLVFHADFKKFCPGGYSILFYCSCTSDFVETFICTIF